MNSDRFHRDKRRQRRKKSVSRRVRGTADKPRLSVFKSNKHLSAQLINDEEGCTLVCANTMMKEMSKNKDFSGKGKEAARHIGSLIADQAKHKNIQKIVFDRGRYKYHGLLAELANAAREAGLQF